MAKCPVCHMVGEVNNGGDPSGICMRAHTLYQARDARRQVCDACMGCLGAAGVLLPKPPLHVRKQKKQAPWTKLGDFPGGMPGDAHNDEHPQPPTEEDGSTFGGYAGDGTTTDPNDEGADTAEPGYDDNSQMPPSIDLPARARKAWLAQQKSKVPTTKMEEAERAAKREAARMEYFNYKYD
jgi:hypothetical protein